MQAKEAKAEPRDPGELISKVKHAITAYAETANQVKGRRDFFEYFDMGVLEATEGKLNVTYVRGDAGDGNILGENTTGWHYHDCDWQWTFLISGEIELLFEDGTRQVKTAGCTSFLPGFVKHNEVRMSGRLEAIEITSPGTMGTFPCDVPEAWRDRSDD